MVSNRFSYGVLAAGVALWACAGGDGSQGDDRVSTVRDLRLAPAESVAVISDAPVAQPKPAPAPRTTPRAPQPRPQPQPQAPPPQPEPQPAPPPIPSLEEGTLVTIYATDTLTSRHNKVGETVMAIAADAFYNDAGEEIIPAGAVFLGTISDLAPAESPGGEGRMVLTFNRVEFGGNTYSVQARVGDLPTHMKGRGVTGGDAAKVGAGAVVGAIAGRILGGNSKGTAIGAAAGAAAGVGVAAATRDVDIILDGGVPIELVLTAPFERKPMR